NPRYRVARGLARLAPHRSSAIVGLDVPRVVACFGQYLDATGDAISRAQAEERMFAKLENADFLADVRPLLAADEAEKFDDEAGRAAFSAVFSTQIPKAINRMLWLVIERVFEALAQRICLVELAGFPSVNGLHDQLVAQLLHSMGELAVLGDFAQLV